MDDPYPEYPTMAYKAHRPLFRRRFNLPLKLIFIDKRLEFRIVCATLCVIWQPFILNHLGKQIFRHVQFTAKMITNLTIDKFLGLRNDECCCSPNPSYERLRKLWYSHWFLSTVQIARRHLFSLLNNSTHTSKVSLHSSNIPLFQLLALHSSSADKWNSFHRNCKQTNIYLDRKWIPHAIDLTE